MFKSIEAVVSVAKMFNVDRFELANVMLACLINKSVFFY